MSEYKFIVIPILVVIITQLIKTFIESIKYKKIDINRLLNGTGGMPSSHSSLVTSLNTLIALNYGFDSIYFAISFIFGIIVLYDAMGIRYEAGKQAEAINLITKKINIKNIAALKEKVGHKPIEFLVGIITGIFFTLIFNKII